MSLLKYSAVGSPSRLSLLKFSAVGLKPTGLSITPTELTNGLSSAVRSGLRSRQTPGRVLAIGSSKPAQPLACLTALLACLTARSPACLQAVRSASVLPSALRAVGWMSSPLSPVLSSACLHAVGLPLALPPGPLLAVRSPLASMPPSGNTRSVG
ncbi:hypothetical protein OIU79_020684 [Salix purpurea]|uniref:Uncharacterized protein n=1 Tax=Salix purpurea TaxID=77065 RepID=A0A9Q1AG22_SALPP|nr:hypothetical protein OIU79_020684 [Salix purpurea]